MRINRSLSTIVGRAAAATLKKTVLTTGSLVLVLGAAFVTQNFLTSANLVYAVTTPDSCFAFDASTNTITDYYDNEGNNSANPACPRAVDIPSTIGGVAVTKIGNAGYPGAFTSKGLTSVTIPNSVTSIGEYAFLDNQLTNITIPNSVTSIGDIAFSANQLTNIAIPNSVTNIGSGAFSANQLTDATIPTSVTSFSRQIFAFNKFTALPSYFSQPSITAIPESMFEGNQFTTLAIPSNIKTIARGAFDDNKLTAVTFQGPVTSVSGDIFAGNPITQITYGGTTYTDSIPVVNQCYAFSAGTITDYKLYDITLIKNSGIACMKHDVIIPSTIGGVPVTTIDGGAFWGKHLTSVGIPNSVTSIGGDAFFNNQLTSLTIPNSVRSIGEYAFFNNQLTSLTIPNSVRSIGEYAFFNNQLTSLTILEGVTTIGDAAFEANNLTSITIPNSVISIGDAAFEANNLTSITIPNSVISIGSSAFGWNKLITVTILNSSVAAQSNSFSGNPIESITLGATTYTRSSSTDLPVVCFNFDASSGTVNGYSSYSIPALQSTETLCGDNYVVVNIPNAIDGVPVTTIGDAAFYYNRLASVTIPDTVTSIGDYAFEGNNLTALTIPTGITTIGNRTFAMNELTAVTIPNNITSINPTAFFGQNPWGGGSSDPAHDWYSGDAAVRRTVYDNIWYVRLYTVDPTNPNSLKNGIANEAWYSGYDINNDGDHQDSLGGHLINPSSTTIRYRDNASNDLAPTKTVTGRLADTTDLSDYLVKNVSVPAMTNSAAPTLQEQTALDQALSVYHRAGTHVSLTAPTIAGYQAPTPASPYAKTLVAGDNIVDFTYHPYTTNIDFSQNPTSPYGTTIAPVPTNLDVAIASSDLKIDDTKPCTHIAEASLLPASGLTAPDATYDILGGIDFTLTCTADGATAAVTYTLGSQFDTATVKVYKYNATTKTATDITSQVTLTNVNGKTVIAYSVTDGAANDEDATVNKQVVDPIYLAVARSVIAPVDILTPTATLPLAATGNSGLAETGRNVIVAVVGAFAVIIFGLLGIVRSRFVKQ